MFRLLYCFCLWVNSSPICWFYWCLYFSSVWNFYLKVYLEWLCYFSSLVKTNYQLCLPIVWLLSSFSTGLIIRTQASYWILRVSVLKNIENIIQSNPKIINSLAKLALRYFSLLFPNPHSFTETIAQGNGSK